VADLFVEVSAVGIQGLSGGGTGNGATGSTGPAGATGAQGASGVAGASGTGGAGSGATGSTGAQGASGVAGASGISGASGYVGSDGATGPSGAAGSTGAQGASGSTGLTGATGIRGASGADGTSFTIVGTVATSSSLPIPYTGSVGDGYITEDLGDLWVWDGSTWLDAGPIVGPAGATGTAGATGVRGATGIRGASGIQGASGASGISGASGYIGSDGATGSTGLTGATGAGLVQTTFTTSSTNTVVLETINSTLYRSAKYDMQLTSSSMYQVTELRLLVDLPNVYLTQYGAIGDPLGSFDAYYSPASSDYSSPDINTVALSFWNGSNVRIYTTDDDVILGLLSAPIGTVFTLNSGATTFTSSALFTEVSAGIYGTTATVSQSPTLTISRIVWAGTGNIELRFTPVYAVTTLKYLRTVIEV
jgi:hypothetical protein